jgi:hypothetical protein
MNTIPSELLSLEEHTDVGHETDELVEVGAVSETQGGPLGLSPDGGGGFQRY